LIEPSYAEEKIKAHNTRKGEKITGVVILCGERLIELLSYAQPVSLVPSAHTKKGPTPVVIPSYAEKGNGKHFPHTKKGPTTL